MDEWRLVSEMRPLLVSIGVGGVACSNRPGSRASHSPSCSRSRISTPSLRTGWAALSSVLVFGCETQRVLALSMAPFVS